MKIFELVKKVFFVELATLAGFTNTNSLSCISMNNQEFWANIWRKYLGLIFIIINNVGIKINADVNAKN